MRRITKGLEPASLIAHRREIHGDDDPRWDDYRDKEAAFRALCLEQAFLCAYCMSRIKPDQIKIEHWIARRHSAESPHEPSVHAEQRFRWTNLLAACPGGVNHRASSPRSIQHCDSHRGNEPLHIHPALTPDVESRFQYRDDGTICSDDPDVHRDVDKTLNLNVRSTARSPGSGRSG